MDFLLNLFNPSYRRGKLLKKYGWKLTKKYDGCEYYEKDGFELELEFYKDDVYWYLFYPSNKDGIAEKCYLNEGVRLFKITEQDFKNFDFWIEKYKEKNGEF